MANNKRPDTRPARKRYWVVGKLRKNKVKKLIKNGMDKVIAEKFWLQARKRYQGV